MHLGRWKRHKSFSDPFKKPKIPEGYAFYCLHHGFKTIEQIYRPKRSNEKVCKECSYERTTKYRNADPDRHKEKIYKTHIKRKYGITVEERQQALEKQNYSCAICKKKSDELYSKKGLFIGLVIDHCHKTGRVRGLLCSPCNKGLGKFNESITSLQEAILYLKENG